MALLMVGLASCQLALVSKMHFQCLPPRKCEATPCLWTGHPSGHHCPARYHWATLSTHACMHTGSCPVQSGLDSLCGVDARHGSRPGNASQLLSQRQRRRGSLGEQALPKQEGGIGGHKLLGQRAGIGVAGSHLVPGSLSAVGVQGEGRHTQVADADDLQGRQVGRA